jgi:hypothetical protein
MAKNRKSAGEIIRDYEEAGKLSSEEATALREAPQWVIPFADIASFLGGSVIFVGLVWIVIALLQDMSRLTIDAALFLTSALTAGIAYWLIQKGGRSAVLGECVVAVSTTAFAIGFGLLLDICNVHDDYILILAALSALLIGIAVSSRTSFIGTLIIVAAVQPLMAGLISEFIPDNSLAPLIFVLSGTSLIGFSLRNIGLRFIARSAGAASILIASISYSAWDNNSWQPVVGLVIVGLLFTFGAKRMHLEVVAAGGLGITIITGILAGRLFDSSLAQGLSVIGVGTIIVFTSLAISKKGNAVT